MESEITGRNVKVGKELRKVVEEGLNHIEPFTGKGATAHVVLSAQKNTHIAEVTVNARQRRLVGMAEAPDPTTALRTAIEKTEKQAIRWKKTKIERKRQSASVRTALPAEQET